MASLSGFGWTTKRTAVLSAKARKAAALRAAGQAIEVMDEADFVQRLSL